MDNDDMAAAIAFELNKEPWKAKDEYFGEILFENEHGEKFRLTVEKLEGEDA